MSDNLSIAILITSHNRIEKTIRCLNSIINQKINNISDYKIILVDDNSTDGTPEIIKINFPQVELIQGSGDLYWCGGMRLAWQNALSKDFDGFLWLNDDVELIDTAFSTLQKTQQLLFSEFGEYSILAGALKDRKSDLIEYGGIEDLNSLRKLETSKHPQRCLTMNGNFVFVPYDVVRKIGIMDSRFTHSLGDIEYGIRAHNNNIPIYVIPNYVGFCERDKYTKWVDPNYPFVERWKELHSPKGPPPIEYMTFKKLIGNRFWFLSPFKIYLRFFFPNLFSKSNI